MLSFYRKSNLADYVINQNRNTFIIHSNKRIYNNIKELKINILPSGKITDVTISENDGLCTKYHFYDYQYNIIFNNQFKFLPPKDTMIDDQRY